MKPKKLSLSESATFCTQASLILKSGIKTDDGFYAFAKDMSSKHLKLAIIATADNIAKNQPLHQSMRQTNCFSQYVLHMVEIGETTGTLDLVFAQLAEYFEREQAIRAQIKTAVMYPAILFCMMAVVVGVLVVKVLPVFNNIFIQLGGEMSAGSLTLMNFGLIAGRYAFWIILVLVVLIAFCAIFCKTKAGKVFFSKSLLKFSFTRKIAEKIISRSFAQQMSMMLSNGIPIENSLELVAGASSNPYATAQILACREEVIKGKPLETAISEIKIFPELFIKILALGIQAGRADDVLEKLAVTYENELDDSINTASSIAEPAMIGVLATVIGVILVSVMLPLVGIMSAIG